MFVRRTTVTTANDHFLLLWNSLPDDINLLNSICCNQLDASDTTRKEYYTKCTNRYIKTRILRILSPNIQVDEYNRNFFGPVFDVNKYTTEEVGLFA